LNNAHEPRWPRLTATAVFILAAFTLLWPLLGNKVLLGGERSDMFIAGYAFRLFGAETFKATGSIPQWNPYLFGGLPYVAAMHGDIFYPTAWLRWIMPVDLAITWGMVVHLLLAGWFAYALLRELGSSWGAGVVGGVAYELSGIVASQMSPGHDGKIFVSAIAPLAFLVVLRAVRQRELWQYGVLAFVVALAILGHYHMAYFLLLALGLWTLYLLFWSGVRVENPWLHIGLATLGVVIGAGISAIQVLPFLRYIPYSPRADGAADTGWVFATTFALPPREIFTLLLPQFNGILEHYWGQNSLKFHTEYLGVLPLILAAFAFGDRARKRTVIALTIGAIVFLLFAFGGYSPLYQLFFNILPYLNKIRAMGMVFYLTALFLCVLAGIGTDRLLGGDIQRRTVFIAVSVIVAFALLGALGGLQPVAEALAMPWRAQRVQENAGELQSGALRLLIVALLSGACLLAIVAKRLTPTMSIAALVVVMVGDLWSLDRNFFTFSGRASEVFRDDAITSYLRKAPKPYRIIDAAGGYGGSSILMGYGIANALGYHGFELRAYQELGGGPPQWANVLSPSFMNLLSIQYLILPDARALPGFHQVVAPTTTALGIPAALYERDTTPAYARVALTAAKAPDGAELPSLVDPRFPLSDVVVFADTASVTAAPLTQPLPKSVVHATVSQWAPGAMTVSLDGADPVAGHLLISENWYPDWHATVDGKTAIVRRADHTLLSVDLPAGAKTVTLWFASATYETGKHISELCLLLGFAMLVGLFVRDHRRLNPTL
jgi:hypothetical protein